MSLNVLIANDRDLFRPQLKGLLENKPKRVEQAEAEIDHIIEETYADTLKAFGDELQALLEIQKQFPGLKMVILASSESSEHPYQMIELGTDEILPEVVDAPQLLTLIEKLLQGGERMVGANGDLNKAEHHDERFELLTDREQQVLKLIAVGKTNLAVAEELAISLNTVKTHLRNIFAKLELKNRTEAANYALVHGFIV